MAVNDLKRYIGEGNIYVGITKPADLTALYTTWTNGVPAGGRNVGETVDAAELSYKPTFEDVRIEQAYGHVAPRVVDEAVSLKFKCAVASYQNLALALQTGHQVTAAGVADTLFVGGRPFTASQTVALVSPIKNPTTGDTEFYEWVCLYEAYSIEGLTLPYKRGQTRLVDVTINGYADITRTEKDQLFQIGQTHA